MRIVNNPVADMVREKLMMVERGKIERELFLVGFNWIMAMSLTNGAR